MSIANNQEFLRQKSKEIRKQIIEVAYCAQKGHIPSCFSIVETLVTLYYQFLSISPEWHSDRDRFILSKGHASLAIYTILSDLGFITKAELNSFCTYHSILGGHPSRKVPGIEISTGSLGLGPSVAIGMALALKNTTSKIVTLIGDGECNEGSVWEAAMCASKHQLDNYWVLIDFNQYQSYGKTEEISGLYNLEAKWKSFGFNTVEVNMIKNPQDLLTQLNNLKNLKGPKCIILKSLKGLGAKTLEGNLKYHHIREMSLDLKNKLIWEIENHA